MTGSLDEVLHRDGVVAPLKLFDKAECRRLLASLTDGKISPAAWQKGCAVVSRPWYDLATDPRIVGLVTPILGRDVILWGASCLTKRVDEIHPCHTDVESSAPEGGFVSLWIGIDGTSRASGLRFIRGSHRFGMTSQEAAARRGMSSRQWSEETALDTARAVDPSAELLICDFEDGDAALFDGRTWHGSHNLGTTPRTALLLQFAAANRPVRIPIACEWPFVQGEQAPVLLVSGMASTWQNRLIPPPPDTGNAVPNDAYPLAMPADPAPGFLSQPHFAGATPMIDRIACHSSVLAPGAVPHPPHRHAEEELLVIVAGEAELITDGGDGDGGFARTKVRAGDFAYYPAFQPHSLGNSSSEPVLYTMFRWTNPLRRWPLSDRMAILKGSEALVADGVTSQRMQRLLERPSRWLRRLHVHMSVIPSGQGYDAHADDHDVAIVLVGGTIETLGRTVTAPAVLFHPAGTLHGLRSIGAGPARYFVAEFEGSRERLRAIQLIRGLYRRGRRLAGRIIRGVRWRLAARLRKVLPARV
jgi:mannose-6-phosphate isomerase-like protein (cupin superfamily)